MDLLSNVLIIAQLIVLLSTRPTHLGEYVQRCVTPELTEENLELPSHFSQLKHNLQQMRSMFQDIDTEPGGDRIVSILSSLINKKRAEVDEQLNELVETSQKWKGYSEHIPIE